MQQSIRMKTPAHPGLLVRMEILDHFGLSVTAAADILGVTRPALSALVNQRAKLSPEMALRLEKAFGLPMETLMRMQASHDIAEARQKADAIAVTPYPPAFAKEEG